MDWQPVIEKVEKHLEGWQAKLLSRRGYLVLLCSVLSAIPIFYLSVFKVPMRVSKQLKGLMRRFFWRGIRVGEGQGMLLVAWDVVCRPL